MHRFKYRGRELHCEDIPVRRIAESVGTPFYLYSIGTFLDHFLKLKRAFAGTDCLICFSMKSNSNLTVLKKLTVAGAGLDIVSGGELYRARKVGADPKRIVYASVGKTDEEIAYAIRSGIRLFNVESLSELDAINRIACRFNRVQDVAIRINPDVRAHTHRYVTTGSRGDKFGLDTATAFRVFSEAYRYPFLRLSGLHLHIGSQITESGPFRRAIRRALEFIRRLRATGIFIESLNIGGGLGIIYSDEKPQTAARFAAVVKPLLADTGLKLVLEPGRFISGQGGILVTKVIHWKTAPHKTFAVVDAGMNDLLRPSLYGAYHKILPVTRDRAAAADGVRVKADVVGPVCESGDFLARDRSLAVMKPGDLLAVMSCGAYGFTMASNYNSRPRIPEVVVRGRRFFIARRRETFEDLVRGEKILNV